MESYIGKFLDDRYEILDILGVGGMAVVYRAYCHRLNRHVAVKILKSELAADEDLRRRFHDESQAVAMLSHTNIVAVYDVNHVNDCEYIVMELIDGITLKQYMHKRGGCLNWREALHFASQILQGLKHAHSRGIIHRDIKPQNVMVLRDGSVKVTDFGIARSTTSQATMTQEALGSVHYISPEQARGSHIDQRSDIYSAGVVLYEMLTGRLPYEGDNPVSVAIQHINSIPIAPRELNSAIPVGMEQITMKAMASVADRRYMNAGHMLQDLDDFRRNPEIDFGYSVLSVVIPQEDEPTMVRKGAGGFVGFDEDEPTVREPVGRRSAPARFEPEEAHQPQRRQESYDDYDDEYDERRRNRLIIAIAGAAATALIVLFVILWFTVFRGLFADKPEYTVPNLVGYTVEEAQDFIERDELLKDHFTVSVGEYCSSEEVEAGVIMDQTPVDGRTTTQEVTEITVIVSSGTEIADPVTLTLEDYTNQDYRLVKSRLDALMLISSCEGEYNETVEAGLVLRTDPAVGESVAVGERVTIYYSLGPESSEFEMVSLLNLTEEDARNAIEAMKLNLVSCETEYSDEYAAGRVCYQSIPKGITVSEGASVSIKISLGVEPEDEPVIPTPPDVSTPPDSSTPTDDPVAPTEATYVIDIELPAERTESCVVSVYINGTLYRELTVAPTDPNPEITFQGIMSEYSVLLDGSPFSDYVITTING